MSTHAIAHLTRQRRLQISARRLQTTAQATAGVPASPHPVRRPVKG